VLRWQLLTEVALLLLVALLALAAAGVAVPLFRTLLALAVALLVLGALWRTLILLRAPRAETPRRGVSTGGGGETCAVGEPLRVDGNSPPPLAGSKGRGDS